MAKDFHFGGEIVFHGVETGANKIIGETMKSCPIAFMVNSWGQVHGGSFPCAPPLD
jgi:hypothetical protein